MNPDPKKLLIADLRFQEEAPTAEIRATHDAIEVFVHLPSLRLRDAELLVTPFTLRIKRRGDARVLVYALPMAAQAGRFVARCHNGVYTILIARAHRSL